MNRRLLTLIYPPLAQISPYQQDLYSSSLSLKSKTRIINKDTVLVGKFTRSHQTGNQVCYPRIYATLMLLGPNVPGSAR
jgi:hypothetical protein